MATKELTDKEKIQLVEDQNELQQLNSLLIQARTQEEFNGILEKIRPRIIKLAEGPIGQNFENLAKTYMKK